MADSAGVVQDPNNEALCTTGVDQGVQYVQCSYTASLSYVEVKSTVDKAGTLRDVINASASPARLFLFRQPTANEVDVTGTPFNDNITGSPGSDGISAGAGNDQITDGAGADTISGGGGVDAISYADHTAAVDVTIGSGSGTGNDGGVQDGLAGARDNVQDGEGLAGTAASDRLVGDAEPNSLAGGDGDDVLEGGGGDDQLDGGPGTNTATSITPPQSSST